MTRLDSTGVPYVIGPLGQLLTLATLPPAGFNHWVPRRKAEVVAAVRGGLLTMDEALERYSLTIEEYSGWERAMMRHGVRGLGVVQTARDRAMLGREQKC